MVAISIADGAADGLIFICFFQFLLRVGAADDDSLVVVFNFDDGGVWMLV